MNLQVGKALSSRGDASNSRQQPLVVKEERGLDKRGGLTTCEYTFLKEVYSKFEDPSYQARHSALNFPKKSAPKAPDISYYRDVASEKRVGEIDCERLDLLCKKKGLLRQLDRCVGTQAELIRRGEWRETTSRTTTSSGTSTFRGGGSSSATARTDYSYAGGAGGGGGRGAGGGSSVGGVTARTEGGGRDEVMATFRGKAPPHTYTRKELMDRPKNVPQLW